MSGGGARGLAHIGVIEELESRGYKIASIAGSSMGALVGGVYAVGKLKEFKDWMIKLDKVAILKLVDFTFSSQGIIKGDKVLTEMKNFIPDTKIEDLSIDYSAVATDLINSEEVVFNTGSLYKAIRASISIPTVITPVKTKDLVLIDGGVINNIPINRVKRHIWDKVVAVNVSANIPAKKRTSNKNKSSYLTNLKSHLSKISKSNRDLGYFDLVQKTFDVYRNKIAEMTLDKYPPDILINISKDSAGFFDFDKADELIEIGREATIKSLE